MNKEFVERLNLTFNNASMADVARRLKIPHATVRNYYKGRLPAPEVLMKIAGESSVSLNWLLMGTGDMYAGQLPPMSIGRFIEARIGEIVDQRLAELGANRDGQPFDVEAAVLEFGDPQRVMSEWFRSENREYPQDSGAALFRDWETLSTEEKVAAVWEAKRVVDRSL
jgi:AcrR family transcriptional regulator